MAPVSTPEGRAGAQAPFEEARRWLELLALYVALPAAWLGLDQLGFPAYVVVPLLAGSLLVFALLWRSPSFDRRSLIRGAPARELARVLITFVLGAAVLTLVVMSLLPERLFALPRQAPWLWLAFALLYAPLSVVPQELLFRVAFVQRYGALFRSSSARVLTSAALFGYAHVIYLNWPSIALTFAGGLLFATTYERTRSLPLITLEHTLYGLLVFTLGLERYFLHELWLDVLP